MMKAIRATLIAGLLFLLQKLEKGSGFVMALLLAQRIILGKLAFAEVPDTLKVAVKEHLVDAGVPELATEE